MIKSLKSSTQGINLKVSINIIMFSAQFMTIKNGQVKIPDSYVYES